MKTTQALIFCTYFLYHTPCIPQKAIICVAIADLLGQPITSIIPDVPAEKSYTAIALCGTQTTSAVACPRLHQLLYNDIIDVIKEVGDEVCIQIPQTYYLTQSSHQPQNCYWTLKKNICYLDALDAHSISPSSLPDSVDFLAPFSITCRTGTPFQDGFSPISSGMANDFRYSDATHGSLYNPNIVTLTEPYFCSKLKITFSAGTRFTKTDKPAKKRASNVEVLVIDYAQMKQLTIKIPLTKCMICDNTKTKEERTHDFIFLLKKWAHRKQGHIPYVWGGTSFSQTVHGNFKEIAKTSSTGDYAFYEYEKNMQSPRSGFDCSGLILRAAHICGIPYFCKNTTTIAQCLTPLSAQDTLHAGDLILIKGHVMVVSDLTKNLLIEARSYGHGYGKVHEIPLNRVFDEIETYDDLCKAYHEKKVVKRKDKEGKVRDTFSNLQLFLGPS